MTSVTSFRPLAHISTATFARAPHIPSTRAGPPFRNTFSSTFTASLRFTAFPNVPTSATPLHDTHGAATALSLSSPSALARTRLPTRNAFPSPALFLRRRSWLRSAPMSRRGALGIDHTIANHITQPRCHCLPIYQCHGDCNGRFHVSVDLEKVIHSPLAGLAIQRQALYGLSGSSRLDFLVPFMTALHLEKHFTPWAVNETPRNLPPAVAGYGEIDVSIITCRATVHNVSLSSTTDGAGSRASPCAFKFNTCTTRKRITVLSGIQGDRDIAVVHTRTGKAEGAMTALCCAVVGTVTVELLPVHRR